jgi:glutathione S-transferase
MVDIELFQFFRSHFNEKARWALDFKRIPHVRHTLLPGPHRFTVTRLSGQPQVPVLRHGEAVIAGSDRIIDHLERHQPEPSLYPKDAEDRRRALAIQSEFDEEVGPAIRRAVFAELMADPGYFASTFTDDRSLATRAIYRLLLPVTKAIMSRDLGITPEAIEPARSVTRAALDRVAAEAGPEGYLVGSEFSVADLTAASLLMPAVQPPQGPLFPEPRAKVLEAWLARWEAHPGGAWVREMYARHRGTSAAVEAAVG